MNLTVLDTKNDQNRAIFLAIREKIVSYSIIGTDKPFRFIKS